MRKYLIFLLLIIIFLTSFIPIDVSAEPKYQQDYENVVRSLLNQMTPEEKVGQLFLVTFKGTNVGQESLIHALITNYHIGGVLLKRDNDNFVGPENTVSAAWRLINQLQTNEWDASTQPQTNPDTNETVTPNYIPLFIAISHEGDGYPYSEMINGMSPIPNQMTLGATWNPEYAQTIGGIVGAELSSIGINLLMGPSLDILEDPSPDDTGNLGTRTFGGDPFWVGEFGKAYVRGVHLGSQNKIALVGKYFPGRGASDRPPEEEVATIRKTLEQLKQTDLAPFFAVTGDAPDTESTIDALLTSHIKYQGFQSNIRSTTRPISFDPQAFDQLMSLPAFSVWRDNGGIMVSDELGSRAVRRFFSPSDEAFNTRFVARDALLAGNDILNIGDLISSEFPDTYTTVIRTVEFFAEKYREDPAFALRVDDAVFRILSKKFELYESFLLDNVLTSEEDLEIIQNNNQIFFEISQEAATLISPQPSELENVIPNPPGLQDRIVFISDSYSVVQCSYCEEQPVVAVDTLEEAVLRLYGPEAGAQTTRRNLLSFSYEHLQSMLDRGINRTEIEFHIKNAQWLVIAMLDVREQRSISTTIKRFLDERPDLLRDKQVIIFAHNAPYYLDATDISKLTAYYGLYSKTPQSFEVAARLLFNEIRPLLGALPVSVPGIGYDLFEATTPNPNQTIELFLDIPGKPSTSPVENGTPNAPPEFRIGDLVPIRSGILLDHNNNPVPDNTEVRFFLNTVGERSTILKEIVANTVGGSARATFPIESQGNLVISASSEPANQSTLIQITIAGEAPTTTPSPTPEFTQTSTPTEEPTPIYIFGSTNPPQNDNLEKLVNWILAITLGLAISWATYRVSIMLGQVRWSMRIGFSVLIGGLLLYILSIAGILGLDLFGNLNSFMTVGLATVLGNSIGLGVAIIWKNFAA